MEKPIRPRSGFKRLLSQSLFASAGVLAAPESSVADADDAVGDVVEHDDPERVDASGRRFAAQLARMNPFDATEVAATAALSASASMRQLIAEALVSSFPLVGDDFVLDQLTRDPDSDVRAAAFRACAARKLDRPRVLVIDDYPSGRAALCACLSELGCDAMGASSQIASLDIAWRELVDIVVVRHETSWTDAHEVVLELQRHAPDLPAIVLSSPVSDELAPAVLALAPKRMR
jgi:CheY-like chemotaxis protein